MPFPNGRNQSWKIKIFTGYIDDENEGVESQVRVVSVIFNNKRQSEIDKFKISRSTQHRDASCQQLCLLDHTIVMIMILED